MTKFDGTLTINDVEKCEVINNLFSSLFTIEDINEIPEFTMNPKETLNSIDTITQDFINALNKQNINKSPGPDHIHPKFLKEFSNKKALPLELFFDKTLLFENFLNMSMASENCRSEANF